MQLTRMRMSGFRSVGPEPVEISYERLTFLLGPNGTGKTAFLQALARMFGFEPSLRRVVAGDFHVSRGETPCLAPGLMEALNPREDESHGGTKEVPRRAA